VKNAAAKTFLPASIALTLFLIGCATQNGNPAHARANKGYVDFHADSAADLWWEVKRFDDHAQSFTTLFSQFKPVPNGILRLELAPGHYHLQVRFQNRAVLEPMETEVDVENGLITPVRVAFKAGGISIIESKSTSIGSTAYGRYGRRTKIESSQNPTYEAMAFPEPPVAYRLKEQMPYAR